METTNAIPSQRSYYAERIFPERIPRMSMSKPMQGSLEIPKGTIRVRSDLLPFIRPFEEKERRKQELQRRLDLRRRQPLFMTCPPGQSLRYVSRAARNNNHERQSNRQIPYCPTTIQQRGPIKQRSYLKATHRDISVGQWVANPEPQYLYSNSIQSYGPFEQQLPNSNSSQYQYQWQEVSNHQPSYLEKWNDSIQQQSYSNNIQWLGSAQQGQFIGQQPAYFNTSHGFTDQKFTFPTNTQTYKSVEQDIKTTTHPLFCSDNTQEYEPVEQEQQSPEPEPSSLDNTSENESIGHWYATLVKWCDSPKEWHEPLEQEYSGPESIHIVDKESDVNTPYDNLSSV